ncbi:MAG: rpiA [Chlamydiales bacterium]|nr:rpiA [Chlamydiales bacterium]
MNQPDDWEFVKKQVGIAAAELVQEGMLVGLGTGTTAKHLIEALAIRQEKGLKFSCIATSKRSEELAQKLGLKLVPHESISQIDLTLDGADEIDANKQMIKGGGGALLREKIVAGASKEMVVLVDERKVSAKLGSFPLPIEIIPFAYQATLKHLLDLGLTFEMRASQGSLYITDQGNYIADIQLQMPIADPHAFHLTLSDIPGVVETGLFCDLAGRVIIGKKDGTVSIWR